MYIICIYVYICAIHAYVYIHAYMYVTMITKEKEAIHLRVRGHGRGLREGSWEGREEEKEGGSDVPLFQLRTCFFKEVTWRSKSRAADGIEAGIPKLFVLSMGPQPGSSMHSLH